MQLLGALFLGVLLGTERLQNKTPLFISRGVLLDFRSLSSRPPYCCSKETPSERLWAARALLSSPPTMFTL